MGPGDLDIGLGDLELDSGDLDLSPEDLTWVQGVKLKRFRFVPGYFRTFSVLIPEKVRK